MLIPSIMLNDRQIKALGPKTADYKVTDGQGLQLTVRTTGAKYWRFQYRFAGKQKMLAFGVYPAVTLAEAREKRDVARKLLANGVDPSVTKKEEKLQRTLQAA